MRRHLEHLRCFYRMHRARLGEKAALARRGEWEVDMVIGWLGLFGIPPFDHVFGELAQGARCPCGRTSGYTHSGVSFPGGRVWVCGACTREWLVRLPPPDATKGEK